jgi:nicotinate-nucleotide pyrophosphorylase (carboxylating)
MPQSLQFNWSHELQVNCQRLIDLAVAEDLGAKCDLTTVALVSDTMQGTAHVVARQRGCVCGLPVAKLVLAAFDEKLQLAPATHDGQLVEAGTVVAQITGPAHSLLTAERTLLNFVGKLSGIATATRQYAAAIAHTGAKVLDTRKTTPGYRLLEKYAVACGGGANHRLGLFDAVLIKDNHLALGAQSLGIEHFTPAQAVEKARQFLQSLPGTDARRDAMILVEIDHPDQLADVLAQQPHVVLLDNMSVEQLRDCVRLRDRIAPQVLLEASGGVTLATIAAIAETGVERISTGAITHSAPWLDIALDWVN